MAIRLFLLVYFAELLKIKKNILIFTKIKIANPINIYSPV